MFPVIEKKTESYFAELRMRLLKVIKWPIIIGVANALVFLLIVPPEFGGAFLDIVHISLQVIAVVYAIILCGLSYKKVLFSFLGGAIVFFVFHVLIKGSGFLISMSFDGEYSQSEIFSAIGGVLASYVLFLPPIFVVALILHFILYFMNKK